MEFLLLWVFVAIAGGVVLNRYTRAGAGGASGLLPGVLGAGMILAGFTLAAWSGRDLVNGMASSRWPAAEARLIYAQVIDETPWWYSLWARPRRSTSRRVSRLYVGYEYLVNGEKYHSNAISFGHEFDTAVHQRERFQYAKPLLAHYDAARPGRAVLDPGITAGSAGSLLLAGIIMLLGGRMIAVTRASRRKGVTWNPRAAQRGEGS